MSALVGSVVLHGAVLGVFVALAEWPFGVPAPVEPPAVAVRSTERPQVEVDPAPRVAPRTPPEAPPELRPVPVPAAEHVTEEPRPLLRAVPRPPWERLRGTDPLPRPAQEARLTQAEMAREDPAEPDPQPAPAAEAEREPALVVPPRVDAERSAPVEYPRRARERGWQGVCRVLVRVGADGRALDVAVRESSGYESLDRAALEGVRQWRFHPRTEDGRAVEGRLVVPVRFRIQS